MDAQSKDRKILIIGESSQLGKDLVSFFIDKMSVLSTYFSNKDSNILCKSIYLDITDSVSVSSLIKEFNPSYIINCSAMTNVDSCEFNRETAHNINVRGLRNILHSIDSKTTIIQISSDYVFDGLKGPYSESDITHPINYYGKTKLESENLLIGSNKNYLIFRTNVLFSDRLDNNSFFSWVINMFKKERIFKVVDDQISNPTHTQILVKAIYKSILLDIKGVYHIGSCDFLSRYEFASLIAEVFHYNQTMIVPIKSKNLNQKAQRPKNSGLKIDKILNEGLIEEMSLKYILEKIRNDL